MAQASTKRNEGDSSMSAMKFGLGLALLVWLLAIIGIIKSALK